MAITAIRRTDRGAYYASKAAGGSANVDVASVRVQRLCAVPAGPNAAASIRAAS